MELCSPDIEEGRLTTNDILILIIMKNSSVPSCEVDINDNIQILSVVHLIWDHMEAKGDGVVGDKIPHKTR